jgi:hypothetical protein
MIHFASLFNKWFERYDVAKMDQAAVLVAISEWRTSLGLK